MSLLQRKDSFEENCKDGCPPCEDATKRHRLSHCHRTGVHYEAKCVDCDNRGKMRKYHGETARNVHVRSKEHLSDLKNKREKSWMLKHIKKEHENENPQDIKFSWKISQKFRKPLERQLTEAVNIANAPIDESLNSKGEYNSYILRKLKLEKHDFQCVECSAKFTQKETMQQHFEAYPQRIICENCEYVSFGKRDFKNQKMMLHRSNH